MRRGRGYHGRAIGLESDARDEATELLCRDCALANEEHAQRDDSEGQVAELGDQREQRLSARTTNSRKSKRSFATSREQGSHDAHSDALGP